MNEPTLVPSSRFVKSLKTETWTSPAHPHVTVEYYRNSAPDPVTIVDITIEGSFLNPTTQSFLKRFGYQADEYQAFEDELAEYLTNLE